jgi:hypothetical protein
MNLPGLLPRRVFGAILAAGSVLSLAAALIAARPVAADNTTFPLFTATENVGVVEVVPSATSTTLNVTLVNARPDATYSIMSCQLNGAGTLTCTTSADATVTTDAGGNAQKSVTLDGVTHTDQVSVVNTGDGTDVAYAATGPNVGIPSIVPAAVGQ